MKHIILLILLVFSLGIVPTSGIVAGENITIARLDLSTNEWTNVTIVDRSPTDIHYQVLSDVPNRANLTGELYQFNSQQLQKYLTNLDFFNLDMNSSTPNTIISISSEMGYHQVRLNTVLEDYTPQFAEFLGFLYGYHSRISGYGSNAKLWPVDMQVLVMTSYPPQYGVAVKMRRGMDHLTVVEKQNLTLVAGNINMETDSRNFSWVANAVEVQSKVVEIPAGGQEIEVQFDSFSYGSAEGTYNYSNTVFAVFQGAELVIVQYPGYTIQVMQTTQDIVDSIQLGSPNTTTTLSYPSSILPLFAVMIILQLIRKRSTKR